MPRPFSLLIWAGTGQGAAVQIPAVQRAAAQLAALLPWVPLPGQRGGGGAAAGARVQMFCFWTAQLNWRCAGSAAKDPSLKTRSGGQGEASPAATARHPQPLGEAAAQAQRPREKERRILGRRDGGSLCGAEATPGNSPSAEVAR